MTKKISISVDDDVLVFVDKQSANRSSFINDILHAEKQKLFEKELAQAYIDQSNDPEFREEFLVWDAAIADGLEDA